MKGIVNIVFGVLGLVSAIIVAYVDGFRDGYFWAFTCMFLYNLEIWFLKKYFINPAKEL